MPTVTYTPEEDGWVRGQSNVSHAEAVAGNGSFANDNRGNTAYVSAAGNFFCSRTYYRFDTTAIPTSATASSAFVEIETAGARGGTMDAVEVHKLFASSDNSSSIGAGLYQTITTTTSTTGTDIGNTFDVTFQLVIDVHLLAYLNTQIAAGAKPAFLLRNKGDYDVATEGNPTGVNTRAFDGTAAGTAPFISITYTTPSVSADNATFFGANF